MIQFEKIRWKNFLSTGNTFTELNLIESRSTLVVGSNGAGKSTMLDALCFGLFNKPFRKINKPQLVNSINEKDCVVEIEFRIGVVEYKVVRGIKPGIFEIYRQGTLIDQDAANRDYQKYLEQSILKLNFKSFTQVVILGSSTFVPFMQLPAGHRREVIEDLLDIQVFSHMNMLLKERVKDNNEALRDCQYELQIAEERVKSQRKTLDALTVVNDERIKVLTDQFKENEDRMLVIQAECEIITARMEQIGDCAKKLDTLDAQYKKVRDIRVKIDSKTERTAKDIVFFEQNSHCPSCDQTIEEDFRQMKIGVLGKKKQEYNGASDKLTIELTKLKSSMAKMKEDQEQFWESKSQMDNLLREEQRLMKLNTKILSEVKKLTTKADLTEERESLENLVAEFSDKEESCAQVSKTALDYKVVQGLLKDGGIKSKIISKYIPVINQSINRNLSSMDTYINFTLDEEFNEVIKSRYRDKFSYSSFSEGEKQKIDLSLLFTWRHVAKLKNSVTTNLLILDEVFDSSLDNAATEELLKILKGMSDDTHLWVISHKGEILYDKFARTLRFDKVNSFSKIVEDV
tara:strand:- start:296 stop:2014 length:1719 start_codon:yes stop_codon:yes gene_type:complete